MNQNLSDNLSRVDLNEDSFAAIFQPLSKEEKEEFLQRKLKNCTKNPDGTYSCKGNVNLSRMDLEKLPVRFKEVEGSFDCTQNKLTSLEGAPEEVGGKFYCNNNELTSLEGAPEKVGGYFNCPHNKLTSLEGAPEEVGGYFDCWGNPLSKEELKKTVDRDYL